MADYEGKIEELRERLFSNEQEPCKEARVAAEWWADILRENDVQHDNGEAMGSAMTNWARAQDDRNESFDPGKVDQFENLVAHKIQGLIEKRTWDPQEPWMGTTRTYIKCDYHAHPILQESAEEVEMEISSMTTFPVKTGMQVNPNHVKVSAGYRGNFDTVWEPHGHLEEVSELMEGTDFRHRIFPSDNGYYIRVYREVGDSEEQKVWGVPAYSIKMFGVEAAMEQIIRNMEEWKDA